MAQPSGNPKIIWKLRILGPDHYGRQLQRAMVITGDSLQWLKKDLFLCGLGRESLQDPPGSVDNLMNLKLKVRKNSRSVHILACNGGVSEEGHLFLHLIDAMVREYLDQQLPSRQQPQNQQVFEALIDNFVSRYKCPIPHKAFIEDSRNGVVLFSTDQSYPQK